MDRRVKITEATPPPSGKKSPVNHQVYVGSDEEGWVEVPRVTTVDLMLRQGEIRRAVITVLLPQVEFEGEKVPFPGGNHE